MLLGDGETDNESHEPALPLGEGGKGDPPNEPGVFGPVGGSTTLIGGMSRLVFIRGMFHWCGLKCICWSCRSQAVAGALGSAPWPSPPPMFWTPGGGTSERGWPILLFRRIPHLWIGQVSRARDI